MPKFNSFKTFAAVMMAASLGALTSCTDYTEFSEAEIRDMEQLKKYTELFEARFGKIDPNHTWGMDEEIGAIGAFSDPMVTRAGGVAGTVLVNRNQWTEFDNNSKHDYTYPNHGTNTPTVKIPDYRESALGHDIQIPGFPHLNGLYYVANGDKLQGYVTGDQVSSGMIPAGDVTPYEIQYVSNWFRTHPNPQSIDLHLTDFFIQNVSWDNDQVEYRTEKITPYKTGWQKTGNNGANITSVSEAQSHKTVEKDNTLGTYTENLTDKIDYFLDYLGFQDMEGDWTHVNNFNKGNSNENPEDDTRNPENPFRQIMYVKSSGTENFTCRSSWSNSGHERDSRWVLVHLTWNETVKHTGSPYEIGTVIPREGYYLAFDFAGEKDGQGGKNQIVHPDGYYSNWILKITPGYFNPAGKSKRIFCEDLGATDDIDFNDAVVDVAFEKITSGTYNGKYQPIITVQATGATLPIYVEKEGSNYELHKMLGSDNYTTMINVAAPGNTIHPVATYRGGYYDDTNAGQISIKANGVFINGVKADDNGNERTDNIGYYKDKVNGKAPMAFSTPTTVMWMKERKSIDLAYQNFTNWVQDQNWQTAGTNSKWYENVTDAANNLYPFVAQMQDGSPTSSGGSDNPAPWIDITPDPDVDVKNAVAKVGADSYMRLNGYTGADPIVNKLGTLNANDRVTFVVVLSSDTEFDENALQATLIPADIDISNNLATMSYQGADFAISDFKHFNSATYNANNHDFCTKENDTETDHKYTYSVQFSFTKSQIMRDNANNDATGFHGYMLFFLKSAQAGHTMDPGSGNATGVNGDVTVRKWYVHY